MTTMQLEAPATKRVICRCEVKGCKYAKAFDVDTEVRRITTRFNTFLTTSASSSALMGLSNNERCPSHPRNMMRVRVVEGNFSPDHVCDSRCTGAIGHSCDCQCGGVNHGSAWL